MLPDSIINNIYWYSSEAKQEEDNYKAYKEKNKLSHVNYVGTIGMYIIEKLVIARS